MQKFLRGTGVSPSEFIDRGWCREEKKMYRLPQPLGITLQWKKACAERYKPHTSDYDQAVYLIGACFDESEIDVLEELKSGHVVPKPALLSILEWLSRRGTEEDVRNATRLAYRLLRIFLDRESRLGQVDLPEKPVS
jgi:hypothetical protein